MCEQKPRQTLSIRQTGWRWREVEPSDRVFVLLTCLDAFSLRTMPLFNRLLQQRKKNTAPTRLTPSLDKLRTADRRAAHARFLMCPCKCSDIVDRLITRVTAGVETARSKGKETERDKIKGDAEHFSGLAVQTCCTCHILVEFPSTWKKFELTMWPIFFKLTFQIHLLQYTTLNNHIKQTMLLDEGSSVW